MSIPYSVFALTEEIADWLRSVGITIDPVSQYGRWPTWREIRGVLDSLDRYRIEYEPGFIFGSEQRGQGCTRYVRITVGRLGQPGKACRLKAREAFRKRNSSQRIQAPGTCRLQCSGTSTHSPPAWATEWQRSCAQSDLPKLKDRCIIPQFQN